jgi:hypothetical protein
MGSNMNDFEYGLDPMGRTRLFGIYKGKVVDIDDPLKKQRIKIKVNQSTGAAKTSWAESCQPISNVSNHPDHQEHTAAQIAALLTTVPTSTPDPFGSTNIPALTVVPKAGAGTLKHPHKSTVDTSRRWNDAAETAVEANFNPDSEHTHHRLLPKVGQEVWVMFVAGDPEYPVWIGVVL